MEARQRGGGGNVCRRICPWAFRDNAELSLPPRAARTPRHDVLPVTGPGARPKPEGRRDGRGRSAPAPTPEGGVAKEVPTESCWAAYPAKGRLAHCAWRLQWRGRAAWPQRGLEPCRPGCREGPGRNRGRLNAKPSIGGEPARAFGTGRVLDPSRKLGGTDWTKRFGTHARGRSRLEVPQGPCWVCIPPRAASRTESKDVTVAGPSGRTSGGPRAILNGRREGP